MRVLIVEDDYIISSLLKKFIEMRGHFVKTCANGEEGLESFKEFKFDIILLDVNMPKKDGFTLAEEIRQADSFTPILFISSNNLAEDKIQAFKIGADDYVTKPINPEEVLLRIEAIINRQNNLPKKRRSEEEEQKVFKMGEYEFDYAYQKLEHPNAKQRLTNKEASLLRFLYLHRNKEVKRDYILQEVWGEIDFYKGRSLDVFMSKLRKYLQYDKNLEIINLHGIGFKFVVK